MREFFLDEKYFSGITVKEKLRSSKNYDSITSDDIIDELTDKNVVTLTQTKDSPQFTELREKLSDEGFIRIERSWWNGDEVKVPFKLNGVVFMRGDQFPCAVAMKSHMKYR